MFRGYLNDDERYRRCFAGGWYLTGDLARRDADGYFWFVGRSDDVIKISGHLIGPFEVESALLEHPAVAEAGVIGMPDPVMGEVVKAFVALSPGSPPNDALNSELLGHARKRLGAAVAPKEIAFLDSLPRTRSGKIMRRLLKARELGLPRRRLVDARGPAVTESFRRRAAGSTASAACSSRGEMLRIRRVRGPLRGTLQARASSAASCICTTAKKPSASASCRRSKTDDAVVSTYREHGHALAARRADERA